MTLQTSYKQHGVKPLSKKQIAAGTPIYVARSCPLSTITGVSIATEQWHGELKIPAKYLKAGNVIRYKALVRSTLTEGVQSWSTNLKWSTASGAVDGDVTGTDILDETIATPTADNTFLSQGFVQIVIGGINGRSVAFGERVDGDQASSASEAILIAADDCSVDHWLKMTGDATATSANLSFELSYMEVEVFQSGANRKPSTMGIGSLDRKNIAEGTPIVRKETTEQTTVTAAVIDTEQIFAELTIDLGQLSTVGRCIRFTLMTRSNANEGVANYLTRVRIGTPGGITGLLVGDHNNPTPDLDDITLVQGIIVVTSIGSAGTIDAAAFGQHLASESGAGLLGNATLDMTQPLNLIALGDGTAVSANLTHTLIHFSYEMVGLAPTPISQRNQ